MEEKYYGYIYLTYDQKTKKVYVGKHKGFIEDSTAYYGSGLVIKRIQKKRGNFFLKKFIIGVCFSEEELNKSEKECIYFFRSFGVDGKHNDSIYGYNLTKGGEGVSGYKHSKESLIKQSKSHKNISEETRNKMRIAKQNMSDDTKIKISMSKKGVPSWNKGLKTPEHVKEKIRETSKKRTTSLEVRQKISDSHKNKIRTKEHCDNISKGKKGIKFSEEHKQKLGDSHKGQVAWNKGKPHSEEMKFKLKLAWKRRKQKAIEDQNLLPEDSTKKMPKSKKSFRHTEDTKKRISEYNKSHGIKPPPRTGKVSGKDNPMYGRSVYDIWLEKYGKEEADRRKQIAIEKMVQTKKNKYGRKGTVE